jgi:Flp pilus assembly protein CpaB
MKWPTGTKLIGGEVSEGPYPWERDGVSPTGRIARPEPNLQGLPVRTAAGAALRHALRAAIDNAEGNDTRRAGGALYGAPNAATFKHPARRYSRVTPGDSREEG